MNQPGVKCCPNCFVAAEPREFVVSEGRRGNCSFCSSVRVPTCDPSLLQSLFEPVIAYYEVVEYGKHYLDPDSDPTSHGDSLGHRMQDDWGMFSDRLVGRDKVEELVDAIFDGAIDTRDIWTTVDDRWYVEPGEETTSWQQLAQHLKSERRYVLDDDAGIIDNLRERLGLVLDEAAYDVARGSHVYRSRRAWRVEGELIHPLPRREMTAPPPSAQVSGRANPPGISYLYVATDKETAVAEQRLGVGAFVSLATLRVRRDLTLADLSAVEPLASPFGVEYLAWAVRSRELLRALGRALSKPVARDDSPLKYVPSQFLCEMILDMGYDGVLYRSGYASGLNIVVFDLRAAMPICVELAEVTGVQLDFALHEAAWNEET